MPLHLQEAVGCHHQPDRSKRHPVEAALVHLADLITHSMQLGSTGEKYVPPLNEKAWDLLKFSSSILTPTMRQVDKQFYEVLTSIFPDEKHD